MHNHLPTLLPVPTFASWQNHFSQQTGKSHTSSQRKCFCGKVHSPRCGSASMIEIFFDFEKIFSTLDAGRPA
jgi:hypothetical protein